MHGSWQRYACCVEASIKLQPLLQSDASRARPSPKF